MKKVYKIVFLGNSFVGKTTLISQYLYSKVHTPAPTIGLDFLSTTMEIKGITVRLQLWDTAGQEKFHSIISNYTRNTFLAVIVFSAEDLKSVEKIENWINDFVLTNNERNEVKILVVCNKVDLAKENIENIEKGKEIANKIGCRFVKTTGLLREGIEEMIEVINELIIEDVERIEEIEEDKENRIKVKTIKNRRCC